MKNANLPKISILLQFGSEILGLHTNPSSFVSVLKVEQRQNYKDLYGVIATHYNIY